MGSAGYRIPGNVLGGTMDRVKSKKLSGVQSKEQLQQELKSKEAMINIMKVWNWNLNEVAYTHSLPPSVGGYWAIGHINKDT